MALNLRVPDSHRRVGEAGWQGPPRCGTRVPMPEAVRALRIDAEGNAQVFAFGSVLVVMSWVAALLILRNGWSF
jgi:hypothetical protein